MSTVIFLLGIAILTFYIFFAGYLIVDHEKDQAKKRKRLRTAKKTHS
jgi:hypothetical protein